MELSAPNLLKLGSFAFWTGVFVLSSWKYPKRSPEWRARVGSLLHGSVSAIAGLAQCGVTTINRCRLTAPVLPQQYALMVWSWGYFAFDLLWYLLYWPRNWLMMCHHGSTLVAISVYMEKKFTGCVFPCTLAMMEITNPLLQTRWFLKNEGCQDTFVFCVVDVAYLILFLTMRGFVGTYVVIKILITDFFDFDAKVVSCVIHLVSLAFLYEIYGYIRYKYKEKIYGIIQPPSIAQRQQSSGVL